ncbi:hypothetical protein JTE90_009369 [Oedothorax gibbosus]|uniref:Protein ECT2 n=1 Tax=Oedothorax gibbosus TaxID=931172 RepID=A0AAV6VRN8_9ARAC|nr:hypothetical protein JTE90_009369 [Oedothorax gibbosus]
MSSVIVKNACALLYSKLQLCVVGEPLKNNEALVEAVKGFQVPIVYSSSGLELIDKGDDLCTIFIVEEFEGETLSDLLKSGQKVLGPTIVSQYAKQKAMRSLPFEGCKLAFIGFEKDVEKQMMEIIIKNGGDITEPDDIECTHIVVGKGFSLDTQTFPREDVKSVKIVIDEWCWVSAQMGVKLEERIFTYKALKDETKEMTNSIHCLYSTSMKGLMIAMSGVRPRKRAELSNLVHYMGGRIMTGLRITETTHLVATSSAVNAEKYQYAAGSGIPIMTVDWVEKAWEQRKDANYNATNEELMKYKMLPFVGCKLVFTGYRKEEELHMIDVAVKNGGVISNPSHCTHVVVEDGASVDSVGFGPKARIVRNEWFWECVQMEVKVREKNYIFENPCITSSQLVMPIRGNKRKRLESVAHQLAIESQEHDFFNVYSDYKRRPTEERLSISGSFLDATFSPDKTLENSMENELDNRMKSPLIDMRSLSPRQQVCMELCQTENNYVGILHTIITVFMEELQNDGTLLAPAEIKIIFGNLPPIYEVHQQIRKRLTEVIHSWSEDHSIGDLIFNCANDLLKSYPPFVNFFEESKSMLATCDAEKPRFHAFLKRCQSKPECGRQTLQELLIRPVQRLPSIILLISDILKHTPKSNPDHQSLERAIQALRDVMTHINEDKRKTEGQMKMFDVFNDIENCPPQLLSSLRVLISKTDVLEVTDLLTKKGGAITLFLFNDVLEVCKKNKANHNNTFKSPGVVSLASNTLKHKSHKHSTLIYLRDIKRIVDVVDTDEFKNIFAIVFRSQEDTIENLLAFKLVENDKEITEKESIKKEFISTLCRQLAHSLCKADTESLIICLEPQQIDLHVNDATGNLLTKALKSTKSKLGRALSMRKTPTKRGLSRAVSTIISPLRHFGTPSHHYSNIKLSSVTNLTELAPSGSRLSPSPVGGKKMRNSSSLGVNSTLYL